MGKHENQAKPEMLKSKNKTGAEHKTAPGHLFPPGRGSIG